MKVVQRHEVLIGSVVGVLKVRLKGEKGSRNVTIAQSLLGFLIDIPLFEMVNFVETVTGMKLQEIPVDETEVDKIKAVLISTGALGSLAPTLDIATSLWKKGVRVP